MAKMHGKKLFAGMIPVKGFFVFDLAPTREIEEPFRECNHSVIIHVWPRKALVLGWWGRESEEDTEVSHLMKTIGGKEVDWQKPQD